jgi:hypothetical protein
MEVDLTENEGTKTGAAGLQFLRMDTGSLGSSSLHA